MTIVASGEISLGVNATVTRSVACELALGGTTQICMDQTAVRALAARTSAGSAICFCDFYGKTGPPAGLGCVYFGGYYTGAVSSPANYYLLIAPNSNGCACCQWKTTRSNSPNTLSLTDGHANTYNGLANADHPAGNFTATRSINGFSDWYLPAKDEISVLYTNRGSMPAGQGYNTDRRYWTSTQTSPTGDACTFRFGGGYFANNCKCYFAFVRAIRRVAF